MGAVHAAGGDPRDGNGLGRGEDALQRIGDEELAGRGRAAAPLAKQAPGMQARHAALLSLAVGESCQAAIVL